MFWLIDYFKKFLGILDLISSGTCIMRGLAPHSNEIRRMIKKRCTNLVYDTDKTIYGMYFGQTLGGGLDSRKIET